MSTVQVDVISPIPEGWGICLSCEMLMARANLNKAPHERGLEEYPPEWMEDFERLSSFILELAGRYGEKVTIHLWDPRSLQGMFKSIRYGVRRYPTFVVNGREKVTGLNAALLEQALQAQGV